MGGTEAARALHNSSCISQTGTKPTGVPHEHTVTAATAGQSAGLSSLVRVGCTFFLMSGFPRMPSSTSESWLLSWKPSYIILILKANETCLKYNRRVLPDFYTLPPDKNIPPCLAGGATAPWLMAKEGKEALTNSESVL